MSCLLQHPYSIHIHLNTSPQTSLHPMSSLARHSLSSCCVRAHAFRCAGTPPTCLTRYRRMSTAPPGSTITSQSPQQPKRPAATAAAAAAGPTDAKPDPIVQYVVLRKDLWGEQGWPLGPVIAQACHASSAAMIAHYEEDATTREYVAPANIDHMHKVSCEGALGSMYDPQVHKSCRELMCANAHNLWRWVCFVCQ